MNDFDYENRQKKLLAQNARHKKGVKGSKKCTMPSDHLSAAQKRDLNGPVYTVNLNQPMTWGELRGLPDTLRKQYLTNLIDTYEASQRMLGYMFGVSQNTVRDELIRLGIKSGPVHGRANTGCEAERRKAAWKAFCNGVVGGGNSVKPGENEQIEPAGEQTENAVVQSVSEEEQARDAVKVTLDDETALKQADTMEGDTATATESTQPGANLTRLSAEYDGNAAVIYSQIGRLMDLFCGAKVKAKVVVEVDV